MEITNYDVLLDAKSSKLDLTHENHVGNKRFEVFLNLHKESYEKARSFDSHHEMEAIVDKIIDIVCNKCDPRGRFLARFDGEWTEIETLGDVRTRIHEALSSSITEMSRRSSKVFTKTPLEKKTAKDDQRQQDADIKRRRRGSYARLRRSISESMLFHSTDTSRSTEITGVNKMDVILLEKALSTSNNPGNARFRFLVEMRKNDFSKADAVEKQQILDEIISIVRGHWEGRFLRKSLDGYALINDADLNQTLTNILADTASAVETNSIFSSSASAEPVQSSISGPPPVSSHKTSSLMMQAPILPGVEALWSSAVQGLKNKKEKREIMNRMGAGNKRNDHLTSL